MNNTKLKKLRAAGWKIGGAKNFLKLSGKEAKLFERKALPFMARIERGLTEADRGDFASDEEVKAVFRKYNVDY
ncbi:MAG: hypothetical protein ABI547_04685 [Betaproteobacteria bacterium]